MAGRHRRIPAWRRLLLRLRRSDLAARTAALQAEVLALRATVRALRAELDAAWESAAAAAVAPRADASPESVPAEEPAVVTAKGSAIVLPELPESALLDPKKDRDADVIDVNQLVSASAAETVLPGRRSA